MKKALAMKKTLAKTGTIMLALILVFTLSPAAALADNHEQLQAERLSAQAQSVNPAKATEAAGKFTEALSKFFTDTSKMSTVSSFLTRFGGLTSAASGVVGVLQIMGIVKDPTMEALGKILDAVNNMKLQLDQIDSKLDVIHQELINVAVSQQEIDRNNKATTMLHYWNEFDTNYCEPLNNKISEYQGLVNTGIKQWWESSSHDGIRVLYANVNNAPSLTYAKAAYKQGTPAKADNGESVLADASFGVPASCLPDTTATPFDVNTYRETFESEMAAKFVSAANSHKLDATDAFYQSWNALSNAKKAEKAKAYAADILNTQIYKTSCQVMTDNDQWVISVLNAYRNYCSNVLKQDSGVNAMLNAIYLSHGFEGEAKGDIDKLINGLTVQAGYFGQFALTCACQDSMQTIANRQAAQQQFIDTVTALSNKEQSALVGHDNYCYVTGTVLSYEDVEVTSQLSVHLKPKSEAYLGYTSTDWKTTDPVPYMLDDVYAQVLYRQYRANTQGCGTFMDYLNKYGTGVKPNFVGIMTRWGGTSTFSLDEGITMRTSASFGDYFTNYHTYRVNVGNDSKIENKYFHVHDKITYDTFDMTNGTLSVNQVAGARAFYGEGHWYWGVDESWPFWTDSMTTMYYDVRGDRSDQWNDYHYGIKIAILKSTPAHNFNGGEDENDNNPFFAFDSPSLTKGVSDAMGPSVKEDERTPLTELKLESDSHTYSGSAVEPSVKVLAGNEEVPENGYDITYLDNDGAGIATVTVTGKGAYSGRVSKTYEIREPGQQQPAASEAGEKSRAASKSPTAQPAANTGATSVAAKTPATGDAMATTIGLAAMLSALTAAFIAAASIIALRRRG